MNKKKINEMLLLTHKDFENKENEFVVRKDYNLNGQTLVIPKGMTLRFDGGSINNGILKVDDVLFEGLTSGSIEARVEGNLRNTTYYTSNYGGINNLGITNYSNKTIICDQDESNVNTIVIDNAQNVIFDGQNHIFTCEENFFEIFDNCISCITILMHRLITQFQVISACRYRVSPCFYREKSDCKIKYSIFLC